MDFVIRKVCSVDDSEKPCDNAYKKNKTWAIRIRNLKELTKMVDKYELISIGRSEDYLFINEQDRKEIKYIIEISD